MIMKKEVILMALAPQFDAAVEAEISAITKRQSIYPGRDNQGEYGNFITKAEEIIGYYEMIHEAERPLPKDVTKVMVFDYGCGVGNVLVYWLVSQK